MDNHDQWLEKVSAYADGESSPDEQTVMEAHLEECAQCRQWLEEIQSDRELFVETLTGRQADIPSSPITRRIPLRATRAYHHYQLTKPRESGFRKKLPLDVFWYMWYTWYTT